MYEDCILRLGFIDLVWYPSSDKEKITHEEEGMIVQEKSKVQEKNKTVQKEIKTVKKEIRPQVKDKIALDKDTKPN